MIPHIFWIASILAGLGTLASLVYYALACSSGLRFLRDRKNQPDSGRPTNFPAVSVLKPLKGADPGLYESLRSHCLQDYPHYEIIFGAGDAADPALPFVERLKAEFPRHAIQVVVCRDHLGANAKVSNLIQMLPTARNEYLLVNDSDIRVEPDYLRRIIPPLSNPKTGMVTCLYRGLAGRTAASHLEALGISTDFAAGVLTAKVLERDIRFGLGSTLAFRHADLKSVGGFEALADYLGDDYELGRRIAALGLKIELSDVVVETFLPPYDLRELWRHQLRWARNIRDSRPGGYLGLGLTFGIPWAVLALLFSGGVMWAWGLLAAVLILRTALAFLVGWRVIRDRQVLRWWWMIPVRDCVGFMVWLAGFVGHKIHWRGEAFELRKGKLLKIEQ